MPMPFVGGTDKPITHDGAPYERVVVQAMQMLKTYGRHVGEKLSMVDFVSVMMRWNRRIASSNGVAVRFFMPDAHDHGDEHQCAAEQTRSEHRRIEPMTLHTHDNQHDELRQQRRAPTQYSEMLFAYTVRGLFVHTASMGKSGGMPQANMRVVVGGCGLSTSSGVSSVLLFGQRAHGSCGMRAV